MNAPQAREGDALFCKSSPFVQKAWDSTSLSIFKQCPRKYYYSIIEGWNSKTTAPPLAFGSMLHAALEFFDKLQVAGGDREANLRATVKWILQSTTSYVLWFKDAEGRDVCHFPAVRTSDGDWTIDPAGFSEVMLAQISQDIEGLIPYVRPKFWETDDARRSRFTLVRTFIWYTEQFKDDALQTEVLPDGVAALELSFRMELPLQTPDGDPYLLCGHLDKVAKLGAAVYIQERKHTVQTLGDYYFTKYSPNAQVSNYVLAAQVVYHKPVIGCIIDAAQISQTFSRFGRSITPRSPAQMEEYADGLMYWIQQAEKAAHLAKHLTDSGKAPIAAYPMNEESCHNYGGCQFRGICSKDPAVRQAFLHGDFVRRPWNPLRNRDGEG